MIHLNNSEREIARGEECYDPWCKVRVMLDLVNQKLKLQYVPSRNLSIDESMIGMKNRVVFIQYMPNKWHARFGLKKFELCDSNEYVNHLEIYAGKELDTQHDGGQAYGVVERLMREGNVLNKGYHLYTDNFYTKPKMAEFLYNHKTLLTETIRANSKGLPQGMNQKLQVGETKFWRRYDCDMLALSFREKRIAE
ncbi:PiggyBac transposable element-derived protein 4 [Plakobranchus ocellatus]|uniref:PiggyBac transposable element-derived protein 4 n=1 Tax=Plakobranchus ocellatus TaxID=259542 RepID=A0AAV4A3R6_9GAST|nr:PiggyBac transposable element-derived protein 4 [Plakobranchus ocellatus]